MLCHAMSSRNGRLYQMDVGAAGLAGPTSILSPSHVFCCGQAETWQTGPKDWVQGRRQETWHWENEKSSPHE